MRRSLSVIHVIHDFLPRHRAGSEIYALRLCQRLAESHHVYVLCAEYDPAQRHGSLRWRWYEGLPVVELVNNWAFGSFEETYASPLITRQLEHVLEAIEPDLLHVHNLLNLSMDLPAVARARGIPSVATLHDFTLACPSGGQRVHVAEQHVCKTIEADRCARCFAQSPFYAQMARGRAMQRPGGGAVMDLARIVRRRCPRIFGGGVDARPSASDPGVAPADIVRRLEHLRTVFDAVELFVSPSDALAEDFCGFGLPAHKLRVSRYGFHPFPSPVRVPPTGPLKIGYIGTLVWHKGVHVLVEAARMLPAGTFDIKIFGDVTHFPDYVAGLRERAAGLPVRFMGGFEPEQAPDAYGSIDVLVVPSLWLENAPLVIQEAFMSGVPVVGARMGGIPEFVTHDVNGLLYEASSPAALAQALASLIQEPERLGRYARGVVPDVKSIDQEARDWEAIYQQVLEGWRGDRRPE